MQIRIRESGAVMYESEFRALFPNTSMPQQLSEELINEFGGDVILEGPQASGGDHYQYSQAAGVEQLDGKWYTKYVLGPVFTDTTDDTGNVTSAADNETAYKAQKDAEQAKSVRKTRDDKLKETDWIVIKNLELNSNIPGVWEVYRQALRDIPNQSGFPWTVTWPDAP
tara:strand:- start:9994 stop:10497 length:504 start_codon:yes stop_codon:yes gene_type:complete